MVVRVLCVPVHFGGAYAPLQGCLFVPLQEQLGVSEMELAFVYASRSIAFCVASILTAVVLDRCEESHRFSALIIVSVALAITSIAFFDGLPMQYVLWSVIGLSGGLEVAAPVLVFRAFSNDESKWFVLLMVAGVSKMAAPLVTQLSISLTGQYLYGMLVVALPGVLCGILMMVLPTPRHDHLRGIKKAIDDVNSLRSALSIQRVQIIRFSNCIPPFFLQIV